MEVSTPWEDAAVPNPGSGQADPRLAAALLDRFRPSPTAAVSVPEVPGAGVRMPVRDTRSRFLGLRQMSSPFHGEPACTKWTSGMWMTLYDVSTTPPVQLGVTRLHPDLRREGSSSAGLTFSEAIITGPPQVVDGLADDRLPPACARLSMRDGAPGRVEPLPVAPVGDRTWAYRIIDAKGYVWHWVQVVRFGAHLIEIRIPNQEPAPAGDMAHFLQRIAAQAHAKAARTLT
ncbi:hypothetical protein [Actinomadura hibisca]|uniref:hypothetical protein n=1 Tax=Actinomadura hibisca TaxID=68565 RepID=UPI000832387B|nr:hypothetical protein [Actinomadura hibisca]